MRLDNYARSLLLALGGRRLLAGTSKGHVHFFDLTEQGLEQLNQEGLQVGQNHAALTCLTLAPCETSPPLVVANCMDRARGLLESKNLDYDSHTITYLDLFQCSLPGAGQYRVHYASQCSDHKPHHPAAFGQRSQFTSTSVHTSSYKDSKLCLPRLLRSSHIAAEGGAGFVASGSEDGKATEGNALHFSWQVRVYDLESLSAFNSRHDSFRLKLIVNIYIFIYLFN